ncbi:hypothetical protein SAMN05192555_1312 [Franzmannia pantelleriensis]|uniref:Uncharacterized protein n=1 Tax=Franzmannia pantelleriensis TaxID=48727 RepID=A0A1G9XCJ4_9GAMM|nr:hypothetical protein SAMN05192555_1312 [Halomonas pantelleriensis]
MCVVGRVRPIKINRVISAIATEQPVYHKRSTNPIFYS